jgi:SAM-dependent methyltransferase
MSSLRIIDLRNDNSEAPHDSFNYFNRYYSEILSGAMPAGRTPKDKSNEMKFLRSSLRSLKPESKHVVLEVGCGTGNMCLWLAGKGFRVHGIDFVPRAIDIAKQMLRRKTPKVKFHVCDAVYMKDFEDSSFDCVIDGHCIHYIVRPGDRSQYLTNVRRILKKSGLFLVMTRCRNNDIMPPCSGEKYPSRHIVSADEVYEEMESAGFRIIDSTILRSDSGMDSDLFIHASKTGSS